MTEPNEQQKKAVHADGGEILVSASAGTGKTSTMCQRILWRVLRDENPLSLDRMLIVTFTVASAADMRRKMLNTFREAFAAETNEKRKERIRAQLRLLPGAKICTIDSFCGDLVRTHFDRLDVSPRMRIPDKAELARLKTKAMQKAMERSAEEDREGFADLCNALLTDYSDAALPGVLPKWYETLSIEEEGIARLLTLADEAEKAASLPYAETRAGRYISQRLRGMAAYYAGVFQRYREHLQNIVFSEKAEEKNRLHDIGTIDGDLTLLKLIDEFADRPQKLYEICSSCDWGILKSLKEEQFMFFKAQRDALKKLVRNRRKIYLDFDFVTRADTLRGEAHLLRRLHRLFELYENELNERKSSLGLCEFSDIEHYVLKLLYDDVKTRAKSDLARSLSEEFDEIYVDEYQDVNPLQNLIFEALSRSNRYMVGDVKQSIYGFRGASPKSFNDMRESFPTLEQDAHTGGRIFFYDNYRCDRGIVDFVNSSGRALLPLCTDMHYFPQDDLRCGKTKGDKEIKPAFCLVSSDSPLFDKEKTENAEAAYTASAIKALIDGGVPAEDIAVLSSSMTHAPELRRAFDRVGVPLDLTTHKGFFNHPEVVVMRCVLEMINNPYNDVFFVGALKSPVFGFTLDDLMTIKKSKRGESMFSAMRTYADETHDEKCFDVLSFIARYRERAKEQTVDRLVFDVMRSCALITQLSYGKSEGAAAQIRDNLLYFYDLIRALSGDCTGEIGRVLERVADMAKENEAGEGKSALPVRGHVRMMTIHGSKGLEFPVCWLYGAATSIDGQNRRSSIRAELSTAYGVSFRIKDARAPQFRQKSENGVAAVLYNKEKKLNEYLRLLYVAQTRAINRLYISGTAGGDLPDRMACLRRSSSDLRQAVNANRNGLSMMLLALGDQSDLFDLYVNEYPPDLRPAESEEEQGVEDALDAERVARLTEEYRRRLNFNYPHAAATLLPAKKAVSALYPTMLDEDGEDGEEAAAPAAQTHGDRPIAPDFVRAKRAEEVLPGFAARGTATHAFMQFCDFEKLERDGFEAEGRRLLEERFIDRATLDAVEKRSVERFCGSRLYAMIRRARRLYREKRFMISLPAEQFTADPAKKEQLRGEELLVQGVIDGFFEDENGKIVLFDYKTDHFSKEELKDPAACEATLKKRHKEQLSYYKEAVGRMLGRPVDLTLIYSFALGKGIPV